MTILGITGGLHSCGLSLVKDGKMIVKFNKTSGSFNCSYMNLTSLVGSPKEVGKDCS